MTAKRFEGTFVLAPSGAGKTTTLLYLIMSDLAYVERGEASVIVMDSTGDFLKNLRTLETFHTGALKDKLIIIEPSIEKPFPLNPFALKRAYTGNDAEKYANAAIELISHIFSTVGTDTKFTGRQGILLRNCVRLCMHIPNASIRTLHDIFTKKKVDDYAEYVKRLEPEHQAFFRDALPLRTNQEACSELMWRLGGVIENTTLTRMLCARSSLDFFTELNAGKFIIVNCNRDLLGQDKSSVLGRVIISLIRLAMRERDTIPENKRMPTYFYMDEAHDFLDNDTQVAYMIDDVRKSRLGMTFATQRLAKLTDPNVKDALLSCAILVAKPTADDAQTVARYMETHHEELKALGTRQFYLRIRGERSARPITVPEFSMGKFRHIDQEWVREKQRTQSTALVVVTQPKAREFNEHVEDAEFEEIRPSTEL